MMSHYLLRPLSRLFSIRSRHNIVILLVILCLVLSFLPLKLNSGVQTVKAATTWVVTSTVDDYTTPGTCPDATNCTLRDAMLAAVSGDTITFDTTVFAVGANATIVLSAVLPSVDSTILIIDGTARSVTISGDSLYQIFTISDTGDLTLKALNLTEGDSCGCGYGGAIENLGTLTVTDSTLGNNAAGYGGAIDNVGTLTVTGSTFSNNNADVGGAINNEGTATISYSHFRTNVASDSGGAISNCDCATLTIISSTFDSNDACGCGGGYGGAIDNRGTLSVINSVFDDNFAEFGGAINNEGTTTISYNYFRNNFADFGGAISSCDCATLNISHSTFDTNAAFDYGGAIENYGTVDVSDSTFINNGSNNGGAIYNAATANILNATFIENGSGIGGAINNEATLNIANSTFTDNYAFSVGGAISNIDYSGETLEFAVASIANSTFSNNLSFDDAGTIFNSESENPGFEPDGVVVMRNSIINGSTGGDCVGANWDAASTGNLTTDDCVGKLEPATLLGILGNFGSELKTVEVLKGSNAIDNSDNPACIYVSTGTNTLFTDGDTITTDERGMPRTVGGKCDIGAFEYQIITSTTTHPALRVTDDDTMVSEGTTWGDRIGFFLKEAPTSGALVQVTFTVDNFSDIGLVDPFNLTTYTLVPSVTLTYSTLAKPPVGQIPWANGSNINIGAFSDGVAEDPRGLGWEQHEITITVSSTDPKYNNLPMVKQIVQVYDAGIKFTPSKINTTEDDPAVTYEVRLKSPPTLCHCSRHHL